MIGLLVQDLFEQCINHQDYSYNAGRLGQMERGVPYASRFHTGTTPEMEAFENG